ncbi:MAG: glycosyltransferase family 4 protein [Legionella sp.]
MSIKVCHFTSVHPADDIRIFHKECASLVANAYEVHLIAKGDLPADAKGVVHHKVPVDLTSGRLQRMLLRSYKVYRMAKGLDASIYHFHDPELLPFGLLLKMQGKKVVYDVHEDVPRDVMTKEWLPKFLRPLLAWSIERVENFIACRLDAVVTATEHIGERFRKLGLDAVVVNNFPILEEFETGSRGQASGSRQQSICYVGAISQERGIIEMVQAAETLGLRLILAGAFIDNKTEQLVHSLPGWKNVDYRGTVDRQGIAQIFAESQLGLCILHPTATYIQSMPIKLFEYLSAAKPVIASNFALWRGIVDTHNCGICVDPLSSSELHTAIQWMLDNPDEAKAMGAKGKKAVLEHYNWTNEAHTLVTVYNKLAPASKGTIWYLHHYAGSPSLGMSYRPYYLSREFNRNDYKSYVIAASFHHLLHSEIIQKQPVNQQLIDGQDYVFLKTCTYHNNGVMRLINMLSYSYKVWRHSKKLVQITGQPSVLIVSSSHPFHYLSAYRLAKKHKAKLVFEVRDIWPASLVELLNLKSYHPIVLALKWIEKFAYKKSDHVVSLLPNALNYMQQRGLSPDRFTYISNGVAVGESGVSKHPLSESISELITQKRQQGYFIIGYAGAHGHPNALDDLMDALIILKNENYTKVHFFLVGNGILKQELQDCANKNGLSAISFCDEIPKNQVADFLDQMDAVYLGWKDKPIYEFGISPNKIFDYMFAAKPILLAFSSKDNLVSQTQSGLCVAAEDADDIARGIKKLVALPKGELEQMGLRGKKAVLGNFTYEDLGKKYLALFEN